MFVSKARVILFLAIIVFSQAFGQTDRNVDVILTIQHQYKISLTIPKSVANKNNIRILNSSDIIEIKEILLKKLLIPGIKTAEETANRELICNQPKKTGNCRAMFWRWYFDPKESKCIKFVYGGCDQNKNNFSTEEKCIKYCGPRN